jgi:nicotinamidase-related amidase
MKMKKILIIANMQNDLIDGVVGTKHSQQILPKVVEKIKNFEYGLMYLTITSNDESYFETSLGKKIPEKYCQYMSKGWLIHDDIFKAAQESGCEPIFCQKGYCGANVSDMIRQIKNYCEDWDNEVEIEICGVTTEVSIVSLALTLNTFCPCAKIVVDSDCCAGFTRETHKAALSTMNICGINVVGSEEYNKLNWENKEKILTEEDKLYS